jgi:ubiquitin-conjugating enzyme E2 O
MKGNKVGCVVPDEDDEDKELENSNGEGSSSSSSSSNSNSSAVKPQNDHVHLLGIAGRHVNFKANMEVLFEELLMEFNVKGADTRKFCAEKLKKSQPASS